MRQIIIKSEKDTQAFAKQLAKSLKGGEIIALEGDLGAGKTTMTQYIAKAFGIKENVTSPTFVLMKVYKVKSRTSKVGELVHVDCYRLDDAQELFYLGIEEYMNNNDAIVIIEWADKIKDYLNEFKKVIWINIKIKNNFRNLKIYK